jgi:hypothetical protein
VLLVTGGALAQNQPRRPPTFEAGIDVIRLNLSVTDRRDRLVTGLSETEFAVFEDGIRTRAVVLHARSLALVRGPAGRLLGVDE